MGKNQNAKLKCSFKKWGVVILVVAVVAAVAVFSYRTIAQRARVKKLQTFVAQADRAVQTYLQNKKQSGTGEQSVLENLGLDLASFGEVRSGMLYSSDQSWKAYIKQNEQQTDIFIESQIDGISFIHIEYPVGGDVAYKCQYMSTVDHGKDFCLQFAGGDSKWAFDFLDDYANW